MTWIMKGKPLLIKYDEQDEITYNDRYEDHHLGDTRKKNNNKGSLLSRMEN